MKTTTINTYILRLVPIPGNYRAPEVVRLRHLLKACKRAYGFRAVTLAPESTTKPLLPGAS